MEKENNIDSNQEYEESHFLQLVFSLQSSAWFLLGKVMNPMTGKAEKDLGGAKAVIDTLLMLKNKTKGNLSANEQKLIDTAISNLELNYVEETEKESNEENEAEEESKKTEEQKENESEKDKKTENVEHATDKNEK